MEQNSIRSNDKKLKAAFLKQMKGITSVLNDSSQYWKGTFTEIGKNFCSCTRGEIEDTLIDKVGSIENKENKNEEVRPNVIEADLQKQNESKNEGEETSKVKNLPVDEMAFTDLQKNLALNKRNWSSEEDKFLINFVNSDMGNNWKKLASLIGNKTPQQCAYRFHKLIKNIERKKWTRSEDIYLMELIDIYGKNWEALSNYLTERTPQEIEERFEKKLNPNLKRSKFEKEEDVMIIQLHEKYGNKWNEICKYFNDRNASMIKNRYYSFLKKKYPNLNDLKLNKEISPEISQTQSLYSIKNHSETKSIKNYDSILNNENKNVGDNNARKSISYNASNLLKNLPEKNVKEESEELLGSDLSCYSNMNKALNKLNFGDEMMIKMDYPNNQNFTNSTFNDNLKLFDSTGYFQNNQNDMEDNYINNFLIKNTNFNNNIITNNNCFDFSKSGLNDNNFQFSANEMFIDDKEENKIHSELLDADSPKNKMMQKGENGNNFNEHYKNVFKSKHNSFEIQDNENCINNTNNDNVNDVHMSNNISPNYTHSNLSTNKNGENDENLVTPVNNDVLIKQYKMLEDVFQKVKEVSSYQIRILNEKGPTNVKLITLSKKLDGKRDNLSHMLNNMKNEYIIFLSQTNENFDSKGVNEKIRISLAKQIEILMELIQTTKLKINLIQQYDKIDINNAIKTTDNANDFISHSS